ncbi:MAG TPA: MarR family transcriptional regulator [Armatimonadota bacterium]|nr:MarR family transcriptional regulator [Armatimonadota bacterium]
MQQDPTQGCATVVMDTIPRVMCCIAAEMHKPEATELSVPQFRALMFIKHHEGVSLSSVAEHLGTTLSSTSKLVDGLVERTYVTRETADDDRRRVILAVTESGEAVLEAVRQAALSHLVERLTRLSASECSTIVRAMKLLQSAFA